MKKLYTTKISIALILLSILLDPSQINAQWTKQIIEDGLNKSTSFYAGDIDGDGDDDIAAAILGQKDIVWYEYDNSAWNKHIIDDNLGGVGTFIIDLDKDNFNDIVVAGQASNVVKWYKNSGQTPINWTGNVIDDDLYGAEFVYVADINGDNNLDVIATGALADCVVWYENDGNSTNWIKHFVDESLDGAIQCQVCDIDGDDTPDIVANGMLDGVLVWYKNENSGQNWIKYSIDNLPGVSEFDVADIDNDGDFDIVASGTNQNDVAFYENEGGEILSWAKYIIDSNLGGAFAMEFADMDGDNDLDVLATGKNAKEVAWYENNGNTADTWSKSLIDSGLTAVWDVLTVSIDGKPYPDVIMNQFIENGSMIWYKNPYSQIEKGQMHNFEFDGITRKYELHLPQNFEPDMPLVLALPGYSESISFFKEYTQLHEFADTAGFVVAYVEGMDLSWNLGIEYCPIRSPFPDTDDVGFISALIDTLYSQYNIDLKRVYCCGFSTGGEMCCRLAVQLGERFAAIASAGGGLYDAIDTWHPIKTIPVMHIHGTIDKFFLYNGPGSVPGRVTTEEEWSIEETINYWVSNNNCNLTGDTLELPDLVAEDNSTVQKITFAGDSENSTVIHYKLNNGGHCWPGSTYPKGAWEGNRNMDFSANEVIWTFFKQYENTTVSTAKSISLEVNKNLLTETFTIKSDVINPEEHTLNVYAIVYGNQFNYSDTIELFDNGLQGDNLSADNIWGVSLLSSELPEDDYVVDIVTNDLNTGYKHYYYKPGKLTNYGPLSLKDYYNSGIDSVSNPGDILRLYLILENNGINATAKNIEISIESLDTLLLISDSKIPFNNIPAGENVRSKGYKAFKIPEDFPVNREVPIKVKIFSFEQLCWVDTFFIHVKDEFVNIPDTAFLYALIEKEVDTNGDSLISYEEAEATTSLVISKCNITDLTGINAFINLDTLWCHSNFLSTLDVSKLIGLKVLCCGLNGIGVGGCNLTQLDVSNNTELEVLLCHFNQLTSLDISNNIHLKELDLGCNNLITLNVSNNINLKSLNIHFNPNLEKVCVWDGFSESIADTTGSPNVYFTTDCGVTDANENQLSGLSIYPNPTNNHLKIETGVPDTYNIELVSMNGMLLLNKVMMGTEIQIDLSSFLNGVYIIRVRSKDFVATKKIIKL